MSRIRQSLYPRAYYASALAFYEISYNKPGFFHQLVVIKHGFLGICAQIRLRVFAFSFLKQQSY